MEMPQFEKTIEIEGYPVRIWTERRVLQRTRMCANSWYEICLVDILWQPVGYDEYAKVDNEFFTLPPKEEDVKELKGLVEKVNLFNLLQIRKLEVRTCDNRQFFISPIKNVELSLS